LASILFTANVSRGAIPHLRLKGDPLLLLLFGDGRGLVLDVKEIPKASEHKEEKEPVKQHAGLLDELVLALQ
jgi:hypothetical protein